MEKINKEKHDEFIQKLNTAIHNQFCRTMVMGFPDEKRIEEKLKYFDEFVKSLNEEVKALVGYLGYRGQKFPPSIKTDDLVMALTRIREKIRKEGIKNDKHGKIL